MHRSIARSLLVLALLSACGGDDAAEVPVQQANTKAANDTARPVANPAAPAPAPATTPAPARPAAPPSTAAELSAAPRVRTVQVGSFLNAATAQAVLTRLERDGVPAWTSTAIVGGAEFTRVRIGAAVSADEARALAQKITATYRWPVWITVVNDRSELPSEVLGSTRAYVGM